VAFLGSSAPSVEATAAALRDAIGFRGRGYTSLDELLAAERCDAVSVCTPVPLHFGQALAAVQAGCSVLCEKPFVWQPGTPSAEIIAQARRLVEAAERKNVVLSANTQYAAAAEEYCRVFPEALEAPRRFFGEMSSRLKPGGPRGRDIWIDLASHPLSILLGLLAGAELRAGTVRANIEEEATQASFGVVAGGRRRSATIRVAKVREAPFLRRFGLDDTIAECGTRPDENGVYHGYLRLGGREHPCDDFMKTSLARFCAAARGEGRPLVDAATALRNLEILLATLDEAERAP